MNTRLAQQTSLAATLALSALAAAQIASIPARVEPSTPGALAAQQEMMQISIDEIGPGHRNDPVEVTSHLADFTLQELNVPTDVPQNFEVQVTLGGRPTTLQLFQHSVRAAGYIAILEVGNGRSVRIDPGPDRTYRGTAAEFPGSRVSATLFPDGRMTARIHLGQDDLWHVEELVTLGPGTHAVFRDQDRAPLPDRWCGVHDETSPTPGGEPQETPTLFKAVIAIEGDYEWYDDWGSDALTEMSGIINDDNAIYEPQTNVCYSVKAARLWVSVSDPYTNDNANDILTQFRDRYQSNYFYEFRHVAHLFSGKDFDGSTVGLATVGAIRDCGANGWTDRSTAHSIIEGILLRSRRVHVSAHELGHNWSCPHCDGDPTCGIMSSSVTPWPTAGLTDFGSTSANQIIARRDSIIACARDCSFNGTNAVCAGYCDYEGPWYVANDAPLYGTYLLYSYGRPADNAPHPINMTFSRPMTITAGAGPVRIGIP